MGELERLLAEVRRLLLEDRTTELLWRYATKGRGTSDRLLSGRSQAFYLETLKEFEEGAKAAQEHAARTIDRLNVVRGLLEQAEVRSMRSRTIKGQAPIDVLVPSDATELTIMTVGNELATYRGSPAEIAHELMIDGVNARVVRWTSEQLTKIRGARR